MNTTKHPKTYLRINFDFVDENMNVVRENLSHDNCFAFEMNREQASIFIREKLEVQYAIIEMAYRLASHQENQVQNEEQNAEPLLKTFHDTVGKPYLQCLCSDAKTSYREKADQSDLAECKVLIPTQDEPFSSRLVREEN